MSQLGALVSHDYFAPTNLDDARFRLHRVTIDPGDSSLPGFDVKLGPLDEEAADNP